MSKRKKQLEEFFAIYETHFNDGISGSDVSAAIVSSFSECFVESSAAGVMCGKNGNEFVDRLKQGFEFYRTIGSSEMHIISKDISMLDELHAIAKIHWRYDYEKSGQPGSIDFNTIYILTAASGDPKIFAYMAGDEQKALREKGLLQETESMAN